MDSYFKSWLMVAVIAAVTWSGEAFGPTPPKPPAPPEVFPMYDFMNHGYNKLKGAPIGTNDKGWTSAKVFDYGCPTCFSRVKSFEDHIVPDALVVSSLSTCSYTPSKVHLIRGTADWQKAHGDFVSFDESVQNSVLKGLQFLGSPETSNFVGLTANGDVGFTYAHASCEVYRMSSNMYEMGSSLSDNFKAALSQLPTDLTTNASVDTYHHFVENFGTHVPIGITLGGVATEISPFVDGKLDLVDAAAAGLLNSAAKSSFLLAFGAKDSASLNGNAQVIFDGSRHQNHTICRPLCPPFDSAAETQSKQWSDSLELPANRAVPVKWTLVPISAVIAASGKLSIAANLVKYINGWYAINATQCEAPPSVSYETLPELTVNRTEAGAASLDVGAVLIAGGFTEVLTSVVHDSRAATDLVEYSRGTGWSLLPSLPNGPLARFASAVNANKWYIMGGVVNATARPTNKAIIFDYSDHKWSNIALMNEPRSQAAAATYNNNIYVFGGTADSGAFGTLTCHKSFESLEFTSGAEWKISGTMMPECRIGATATTTPEGIYIAGGFTKINFGFSVSPAATILAWNGHWSSISQMPYGVALHSALFQNNIFSIYGGQSTKNDPKFKNTARTLTFDLTERTWKEGTALPTPQIGANAVVFEEKPWLLAGTRCHRDVSTSGNGVTWATSPTCVATGTVNTAIPINENKPVPVACPEGTSATGFSLATLKKWATGLAHAIEHTIVPPPPPPSMAYMNLPNLPNVEIVGRGLDISKSDPDSTSLEPGLRQEVFNVLCDSSCYKQGKSIGGKFKVPDIISARQDHRCSYVVDTDIIHSTFDMQQHLNYWTRTTKKKLFWSHTQSSSMQDAESYTANSDYVMVISKSQCSVYHAALDLYSMENATITNSFAQAVSMLPTTMSSSNIPKFATFVQSFGTHVVSEASFGGFAQQTTLFEEQDIATLHSENNGVGNNAGLHFLESFKQGAPSGFPETGPYGTYKNLIKKSSLVTVPVTPPMGNGGNTSAQPWLDSLLDSPALIRTSVLPLSMFFTKDLFPQEKEADLAAKAASLSQYVQQSICEDGKQCIKPLNATHGLISPQMAQPLAGSPALYIDGQIYFLGGATTGQSPGEIDKRKLSDNKFAIQRFNIVTQSWQFLPPLQFIGDGCTIFSAAALTSRGYALAAGPCGVRVYDPVVHTSSAAADLQTPRIWFRLVSVTSKEPSPSTKLVINTFAIGGLNENPKDGENSVLKSVEAYVPQTTGGSSWQQLQGMETARHSFSTVVINDTIWAIGGLDAQNNILSSIEIYTVSTNKWNTLNEPIPSPASPRYGHESVFYDGAIYIMGGCTTVGHCMPINSVARYAIEEHSWKVVQSIFSKTVYFSAVLVPQASDSTFEGVHVRIFGGLDKDGVISNQTSTYQIPKGILNGLREYTPNVHRRSVSNNHNAWNRTSNSKQRSNLRVRSKRSPSTTATDTIVPGIEYLGYGYNILRGNPMASAFEDDGWQTTPILRVADMNFLSGDNRTAGGFIVPNGVGVNFLKSCTFDSSQSVIRGTADLQAHLDAYANGKVRVGFPFLFDLHFRLSADFNAHASTVDSEEFVYVTSSSSCEFYKMSLNQFSKGPGYTAEFLEGLKQLPLTLNSESDTKAYYDFVETFGTHVPHEITMGAHASMWNQIETTKFDVLAQGSASVSEGSKSSFLFFFKKSHQEGGSISVSEREKFQEIVTKNSTNCKPTCPPLFTSEQDTSAWMNQVERNQNMVPVKWQLTTIPELLKNQPPPLSLKVNVSKMMDLMTQFLDGPYCALAGCPNSTKKAHWRRFPDLKPSTLFFNSNFLSSTPQTLGVGLVDNDLTMVSLSGVQKMKRFTKVVAPTKGSSGENMWATDDGLKLKSTSNTSSGHEYDGEIMNQTRLENGFSIQIDRTVYMFGGILNNFTTRNVDTTNQGCDSCPSCCSSNSIVYTYALDSSGPSAWSQTNAPTSAISSGSNAVSVGKTIIVVGGIQNKLTANPQRLDYVTTFDTESGQWAAQKGKLQGGGRSDCTAVAVDDEVYVFGGQTDKQLATTDILVYTLSLDNWILLDVSLPAPVQAASGVQVSTGIIIAGGFRYDSSNNQMLTTAVYLFSIRENSFTVMAPLSTACAHCNSMRAPPGSNGRFSAIFVGGIAECTGKDDDGDDDNEYYDDGAETYPQFCPSNQVQLLSLTV